MSMNTFVKKTHIPPSVTHVILGASICHFISIIINKSSRIPPLVQSPTALTFHVSFMRSRFTHMLFQAS